MFKLCGKSVAFRIPNAYALCHTEIVMGRVEKSITKQQNYTHFYAIPLLKYGK